jgi:hypothetical protein
MKDGMGASLKFEAEFFRKSNNLTITREKKIRSIQVRTVHMLLLLVLGLLAGLVISRAADFLLHWDALQVQQFRLRRQPLFARARIAGILGQYGGNILAMDLQELQAKLMQVPEVAGASIRRILPHTVEVDFTLRRPFFQSFQDGQYRLLDADGLELGRAAECPACECAESAAWLYPGRPATTVSAVCGTSHLRPSVTMLCWTILPPLSSKRGTSKGVCSSLSRVPGEAGPEVVRLARFSGVP